jgi:hypothetical protein
MINRKMTSGIAILLLFGTPIGYFVLLYLHKSQTTKPTSFKAPVKIAFWMVQTVFFANLTLLLVSILYGLADDHRCFVHIRDVLFIDPEQWIPNAEKSCEMEGDTDTPVLRCEFADAPAHKRPVHFLGPMSSYGARSRWKCKMELGSLSCESR